MSGLQSANEERVSSVDVREQGNALRVATNTPHLVSLGTGRLSTAVTLHPIKQGRVTIGSDPTCDIYVLGTGVASVHCRVENSHGVVTLYPISGSLLLDGQAVDKPTRLSQGSMLTVGRSNYLRFNHPAEAQLMKSVLPGSHLSVAQIHFEPSDGYPKNTDQNLSYQNQNPSQKYRENTLSQLDRELDLTIKEMSRKKPPAVPKKPYKDFEHSDSNSDQESQSRPKMSSIMAKVSKFEYYAKAQQKTIGRSQFYTNNENEISPKVFSSNSLTVNTPAKDVLGNKNAPSNFAPKKAEKVVLLNENNAVDARNCSYANVAIRQRNKIDEIVRNFDDHNKLPKKINNNQQDNVYGKIQPKTDFRNLEFRVQNNLEAEVKKGPCLPSPAFDRDPHYAPVYSNSSHSNEWGSESECKRIQAYQDRIKEEEQKEAENARLEEILSMCAEYERQIASGAPITPTEKRSHNKIITNGSLPRSIVGNHPNFVQTSEGYYKFDTSHNRNNSTSRSLPIQRNLSSYENFDVTQLSNTSLEPSTPEVTINSLNNYENVGRMDEIGIPVFDDFKQQLSSPVMIRKLQQNGDLKAGSPIGSPYENVLFGRNSLKPKSPNTQSPRSRIKTTFAHKNLPSPQYFIFPTPPPVENKKPNFTVPPLPERKPEQSPTEVQYQQRITPERSPVEEPFKQRRTREKSPEEEPYQASRESSQNKNTEDKTKMAAQNGDQKFGGIEKQLSLEEDIPMIDDSNLNDDIEFRYSKVLTDDQKEEVATMTKNKSFDDVKKELMADIPELDEFEKDLKENREKVIKNITKDIKKIDTEVESIESSLSLNDNLKELRERYETLKEDRKKLVAEIHEIKCKMTEIRSQEDDILRELEMEKALIKGEYDSEIAILNIEQKKKSELLEKAKQIEEEIRRLKERQEARQNEMRDRVEIATLKVERLEKDHSDDAASLEELQNAQDILDNETKIYEDLEFQHLEEESELLANREDLQNETILLSKKIEAQKSRILTLKSEANSNLTSALDETKVLRAEYVRLLNQVEALTTKVQTIEKELRPLVTKLNDIERTQSPDSAFFTDQTRAKSGEFGYSPQSSDSDEVNYENHTKVLNDKFNSIDQMSQSMIVDIERRDITELIDDSFDNRYSESPSKSSTSSKEKKGFWERNFDSLKRKKDKKPKSPEKTDIMSQSLNENMFYNNENIETENNLDRFNSLRNSKKNKKEQSGPLKSNSSSKIPTFAALGKIIKKDSFTKKNKDVDNEESNTKNRYTKNVKALTENKYTKKSVSPEILTDINEVESLDTPNNKGHNVTFTESPSCNTDSFQYIRVLHRKSCGDEPNIRPEGQRISDSGKIPSQDDIDRISKVTLDAPLLSSDADMNTLGKKTVDSLKEIERNRKAMLEEQGCQVIESEREKISELKRRVQNETRKLWDQRAKREQARSFDSCHGDTCQGQLDISTREDSGVLEEFNMTGSTVFEESSGFMSSSIEELQVRNSRTESTEDDKRSDDSRPLSHASDFSRDLRSPHTYGMLPNMPNLFRGPPRNKRRKSKRLPLGGPRRTRRLEAQRPLTRYLPVDRDDFDLRRHLESAGHQVELCPHVSVTATSCRGYLHKLGAKFHTWSKRWFVFDRDAKTFVYYWDKTEKKPRGGAYFQVMEEVYLDHGNTSKSPNPQTTFIVKTRQRRYYLMAPSGESARMWIDAIFTGAQGYTEYLE